jgi:hypothetical protein
VTSWILRLVAWLAGTRRERASRESPVGGGRREDDATEFIGTIDPLAEIKWARIGVLTQPAS